MKVQCTGRSLPYFIYLGNFDDWFSDLKFDFMIVSFLDSTRRIYHIFFNRSHYLVTSQ